MKFLFAFALMCSVLFSQILYEEYFTNGNMQLDWHAWFRDSVGIGDSMSVISDTTTPGNDDWAGQISNEHMTMAGLTYSGASDLENYSIEAWIYTNVRSTSGGPYNGIAMRMDPASRYYYRFVSDFDSSRRLRLGVVASGGMPIVIRDWSAGEIPGGVPSTSSWHKFKMKMVVDTIWVYYDDSLMTGCPIINDSVAQGYFGVYTFSMDEMAYTKCDNIIVAAEDPGIAECTNSAIGDVSVYPNPFMNKINISYQIKHRAEVSNVLIYDVMGRLVKSYSLEPGSDDSRLSILWDGKDAAGNLLAPGVYFITHGNSSTLVKVVKLHSTQ